MPARMRDGVGQGRHDRPARDRRDGDGRDQHREAETVDAGDRGMAGRPVGEHDVEREQAGVGERQRDPERLALEAHPGEQVDADDGEHQRGGVARRAGAEGGERDHRQELDRRDGAERQPVDGDVEAAVHDREDGAPLHEQDPRLPVELGPQAPGAAPEREDERGGGDPQPGDAEDVDADEQQDREGGAEVVEDRADDEVDVRRRAAGHVPTRCLGLTPRTGASEGILVAMPKNQRPDAVATFGGPGSPDARRPRRAVGRLRRPRRDQPRGCSPSCRPTRG